VNLRNVQRSDSVRLDFQIRSGVCPVRAMAVRLAAARPCCTAPKIKLDVRVGSPGLCALSDPPGERRDDGHRAAVATRHVE
jgi:hypothetical protein